MQVWISCLSFPPTYPMPTALELLWNTIWEKSSSQIFKVSIHKKAKKKKKKKEEEHTHSTWDSANLYAMGSSTKASLNAPNSPAGSLSLPLQEFSSMTHGHRGGRKRTKWHWRPPGRDTCKPEDTHCFVGARGEPETSWSRVTTLGSLWRPGLSGFYLQAFTIGAWVSQAWSVSWRLHTSEG